MKSISLRTSFSFNLKERVAPPTIRQVKPVSINNVTVGTFADCCLGCTQGIRRVEHISIRYYVDCISDLILDLLFPTYLSFGYTLADNFVEPYPMYFDLDYISV